VAEQVLAWATQSGAGAVMTRNMAGSAGLNEGVPTARDRDRTTYSPGVELIRRPYGHPDVVALTDEAQAHYRQLYGGPGDESLVELADFEAPTGHFVVGYVDGVPVAMGGWRRLGDRRGLPSPRTAEIKRMYVSPAARGRGLSRIVLAELETTARAAGLDWLVLETGRPQTSALGLYRSSGYCEIDGTAYGHYVGEPDAIHLGRSLG
jgi:ribosomal protein S18 acetylase RimI-like enzyme